MYKLFGKIPYEPRDERYVLSPKKIEEVLEKYYIDMLGLDFHALIDDMLFNGGIIRVWFDGKHGETIYIYSRGEDEEEVWVTLREGTAEHQYDDGEAYPIRFLHEDFTPPNIVKQTCNELGLKYKELAEILGYSESAINNASRSDNVSSSMIKSIQLYRETLKLKDDLEDYILLKKVFKKMV